MIKYQVEVVSPVELVDNVHQRLMQLVQDELSRKGMPAINRINALNEADSILIEELQKLTERARQEILHGKIT